LRALLEDTATTSYFVNTPTGLAATSGGTIHPVGTEPIGKIYPIVAMVPPGRPEDLGDSSFCRDHQLRFPYVAGSMANGVASTRLVESLCNIGALAFFGAAGLSLPRIEQSIQQLRERLGTRPFGCNLIFRPGAPDGEAGVVDICLRNCLSLVEASAYVDVTLPLVRYRLHGIHRDERGQIVAPNRVIAKVSRVEVATKFLSPPPSEILRQLVRNGDLTEAEAQLASQVPVAQDVTAEADSGGHTDNRPAIALLPTLCALRDRLQRQYQFDCPLRIGLGGGIATPASAAAAFAMGAAYVLTGSINQACVESGTSDSVRQMLATAEQADISMAPAADLFETGGKVQVLKRGTMFAMRAAKLYEIYRKHPSLEAISASDRQQLEGTIFRTSLETIWAETQKFFVQADPSQIERAQSDPKHKMALVFRWYLGLSSRWAITGDPVRQLDYQVWCGPAMGAFNEWVKGSPLEQPTERRAASVALNLLHGASYLLRLQTLRAQGVVLPAELWQIRPRDPTAWEAELLPTTNAATN
jgi:PfaD family protein